MVSSSGVIERKITPERKMSSCSSDHVIEITFLCCVAFIGTILNGMALLVFCRKNARKNAHRFLVSLTFGNLLVLLVNLPLHLYERIVNEPMNNWLVCKFVGLFSNYIFGVSVLAILVIAWDRFLACVGNPLHYSRRMTYGRSMGLVIVSWILPGILLTPAFNDHIHAVAINNHSGFCTVSWSSSISTKVTAVVFTTGTFYLSIVAVTAIYAKIFLTARSTASQCRRSIVYEFQNTFGLRRSITIEVAKPIQRYTRNNSMASIQSFLTGQENSKTAQMIIWIILSCTICYLPVGSFILLEAFHPDDFWKMPSAVHRIVNSVSFMGTIFHPLIYIFSSSSLRRDIGKLFMRPEEIRRQSSLQMHGNLRSHSCLPSRESSRYFSNSGGDSGLPSSLAFVGSPLVPLITCTSPDQLATQTLFENDFPDDLKESYSAKISINSFNPYVEKLLSESRRNSNRSLSRKSVSFVEDVSFFIDKDPS